MGSSEGEGSSGEEGLRRIDLGGMFGLCMSFDAVQRAFAVADLVEIQLQQLGHVECDDPIEMR